MCSDEGQSGFQRSFLAVICRRKRLFFINAETQRRKEGKRQEILTLFFRFYVFLCVLAPLRY